MRGGAVNTVSDQRIKRVGVLVYDEEPDLMADLHTQADLGKGCVPVDRQLGLLMVQPSLPSFKVIRVSVAPKMRVVVKRFLKMKTE